MQYIQFLPFLPFDKTFEYQHSGVQNVNIGDIATCKFGRFKTLGIVVSVEVLKQTNLELSPFGDVVASGVVSIAQIELIKWISRYYAQPMGLVAKMFYTTQIISMQTKMIRLLKNASDGSSSSLKWKEIYKTLQNGNAVEYSMLSGVNYFVKKGFLEVFFNKTEPQNYQYSRVFGSKLAPLSQPQQNILDVMLSNIFNNNTHQLQTLSCQVDGNAHCVQFGVHLIHGKTGSGKTEVYIHLLQHLCRKFSGNKNQNNQTETPQFLLLLPEIGLAKVIAQRMEVRFNCKIPVWHSGMPEGKRRAIFQEVHSGNCTIIVGTRSALFLPFKNLQCIIVDEEHDSSFKQEEVPVYNARDTAIFYAKLLNIPIILGSATPSVESYHNAKIGKFHKYELSNRFSGNNQDPLQMPEIRIVNERSKFLLSETLRTAILENYLQNKQTLVFINRRGFSPINKCSSCSGVFRCDSCDSLLTFHKKKGVLACHHCGFQVPKHVPCIMCGEELDIKTTGGGVEAIHEEIVDFLTKNIPTKIQNNSAKNDINDIVIFSSDEQNTENKLSAFLKQMHEDKIKIVIGTQIASKGYDFANLKLVCIIDLILKNDEIDFKSDEKVMQLLTQVSGRGGRAKERGLVLIQSSRKKEMLDILLSENQTPFYENELQIRKENHLPPFSRFISITVFGKNEKFTEAQASQITKILQKNIKCNIFGPAPAPIAFIRNVYRFKILLITERHKTDIQPQLKNILGSFKGNVRIDIDAISFF